MSEKKNSSLFVLLNGIIRENPVLILILGTCPTLAMSTSVISAVGMGLAATAVLICSNFVISLLRKLIPEAVRIPCYIVIIAGFVTVVDMVIHAFLPDLYGMLGVYLALITVNCIILGRAEMFASKNKPFKSVLDGIGMGIGFTLALLAMATVREVLGNGTFAYSQGVFDGIKIPFFYDHKIEFFVKAPGGMLVYGFMIALIYKITHGKGPKKKSFACEGCPSAGLCAQGSACSADETQVSNTQEENENV